MHNEPKEFPLSDSESTLHGIHLSLVLPAPLEQSSFLHQDLALPQGRIPILDPAGKVFNTDRIRNS